MLKRLILAAMQIVGALLTVLISFAYGYLRVQHGLPFAMVLCGILLGVVFWATLDLDSTLQPWGDRLLGAAVASCAFIVWGRLRHARLPVRRQRRPLTS